MVTAHRPEDAAGAVGRAVSRAAERAGVSLPLRALWAGLAGAGATAPRAAVIEALRTLGLADRVVVGTDVEAAFHDAFGGGPGVMLIAGTGSIVWTRDAAGEERRVGGWGRMLGDEGSGYWIGLEGLRHVARAEDGRAPPTSMRQRLLTRCGASSVDELVAWVERASKADVAALAPIVAECADAEDAGAAGVVDRAVGELRDLLRAALDGLERGDGGGPDVVLWGGLVAERGPLAKRMTAALGSMGVTAHERPIDPPMGAARLALVTSPD